MRGRLGRVKGSPPHAPTLSVIFFQSSCRSINANLRTGAAVESFRCRFRADVWMLPETTPPPRCDPIRSHRPSPHPRAGAHLWAAWGFRAILRRVVSRLVRIVQLAWPAFGCFFTVLTLLSMLLVVALCTTSALRSPGKQAIGASPYGGRIGGGSWSLSDSSAAELFTLKVSSDWPSIGQRGSAVVSTGIVCAALTHMRIHARSTDWILNHSSPDRLLCYRVRVV